MISSNGNPGLGAFAASWAILGWAGVLVYAIARLGVIAAEGLEHGLTVSQSIVLVLNTAAMAWAEGWRGFQRRFSPRAAARVLHLRNHATPVHALLAPLFCVGLVGATPRLLRFTWTGAALIGLLVVIVQRLPQPWRGIVDAGVVVGLSWGLLSFLVMCRQALSTGTAPVAPEVPVPQRGL